MKSLPSAMIYFFNFKYSIRSRLFSGITFTVIILLTSCGGFHCDFSSSHNPVSAVTSIKTGEEILFSADDFPELKNSVTDPMHARYIWNFGDSKAPAAESRSVTYTYTNAGDYTVTLEVTPAYNIDNAGTPDDDDDDSWAFDEGAKLILTKNITVSGTGPDLLPQVSVKPLLYLNFNDTINDSSDNPYIIAWKDGAAGSYVSGLSGRAVDLSGGKALVIDTSTLFGGRSEFTITFYARKKDLTQAVNCALWQGTSNSIQPLVRFLIQEAVSGSRYLENDAVYTMTTSPTQTSAYNLSLDTNWHHYAFTFRNGESKLYRDGTLVAQGTPSGNLKAPVSLLYIGYGEQGSDTRYSFNGYIDDLRIYGSVLTERDLTSGFDVIHADFHGHTAQYIRVNIPEQVASDSQNILYAAISGGALTTPKILADYNTLQPEEKFLMKNSDLPGSQQEYCLSVRLLDKSENVIFEKNEYFMKTYDGNPHVGINENNAICIDGTPFFPVTPWGIGGAGQTDYCDVNTWVDAGYINSLYGQGFWPPPWDIDGYKAYLDHALLKSVNVIGPATRWDGRGNLLNYGTKSYQFAKCSELNKLSAYVDTLKNHQAQMAWQWMDEPELYGVDAQQLRSWTFVSHRHDPLHPVAVNFMGHPYSYVNGAASYWGSTRRSYALEYNSILFGTRKSVTDILGIDYYPFDAVSSDRQDTMNRLGTALDTVIDENLGLMPVISCVETSDAGNTGDADHVTPWKPTAEQLKMITWFNVVHGVKGILWFHYFNGEDSFSTPAANLAFMKKFTQQITALTPVVLGPVPESTVSITGITGSTSGRIDTMLRSYNGKLYLIAVRVSEFAVQSSTMTTPPPAADTSDITVSFNINPAITGKASDFEGLRSDITVSGGSFSDLFEPFAVRIYVIE